MNYRTIHSQVRRARGPASDHTCTSCEDPAQDWAYQHTGETLFCDRTGAPYSANIDDYAPMCKGCHRQFDLEHDPRFATKVLSNLAACGRSSGKMRRKCVDCGRISPPGPMGLHLKSRGHRGFVNLPSAG